MAEVRAGEFELIERYLAPLATEPGSVGLIDDAAVLTPPDGCDLVLTKDALAAGIHFFADDPPDAIARKALRVNLSDLAAKGAAPLGYLLGLGLAQDWSEEWVARFCEGLAEDQATYRFPLYGGDTIMVSAGPVLSVTAIGMLPAGTAIRRSTARPGDRLYVTGTIGDAALGLALRLDPELAEAWCLDGGERNYLRDRYLLPQPRTGAAGAVRHFANACMDISDGLVGDLGKMLKASGVGADIEIAAIPLSGAARSACQEVRGLRMALTGGDDYELLIAVAEERADQFERALAESGTAVSCIGIVSVEPGARYHGKHGPLEFGDAAGFAHF